MTTNTRCARNLPQHFNGCACVAAPGLTAEVDIDLSEIGSSAADLLMEQIDVIRREAYEAGLREGLVRSADLIQTFDSPTMALRGYVMVDPDGKFRVEVPESRGEDMADIVLRDAADSLRAYASGTDGIHDDAEKWSADRAPKPDLWAGAGDGRTYVLDAPGSQVAEDMQAAVTQGVSRVCPVCGGHGWGREIGPAAGGGTLMSGSCDTCAGSGAVTNTPLGQDVVDVPGHGTFWRRRDGVYADAPYAMRFEANRPLTDDETRRLAQLIGYKYATIGRGEGMGDPERDSAQSFIMTADTTKGRVYRHIDDFEDDFEDFLIDGSPRRKTDRAGAGTKGTRLVDGLGDPSLRVEIYYDSVVNR